MTVLIVLAVIAVILAVILLIPISCRFYFRYNNELEEELSISCGFLRLNILPPPDKPEEENKAEQNKKPEKTSGTKKLSSKEFVSFVRAEFGSIKEMIYAVLGYMFKRAVKIKKLNIKFVLGLEDAMQTALVFGTASAFIYNVLGVIDKKMRLGRHREEIKPAFNNPHIFAELETIINTCILNILITAVIGLYHALPIYKRFKQFREELV